MDVRTLLLANLDEAFVRKAWHGPNLRGALRGVTADTACWRAADRSHTIWELAAHAAYWKYAVRRKLRGDKRGSFPLEGSNWFRSPAVPDDAAWRAVVKMLEAEHARLRETIVELPERRLDEPKTVRLIYGVAAHDLYHTGQIQLLKRLHAAR